MSASHDSIPTPLIAAPDSAGETNRSAGDPPVPLDWLRTGRIPALDGLRAIAVLLVVFAHAVQTRGFPDILSMPKWGKAGAIGVDIFFVLSGFLITTLLCRERERTGRVSIKGFYWRRSLRILPAFGAYLLFMSVLQFTGHADLARRDWLASLTYTMNFLRFPSWEVGHLWSLSIEEHFYLVWPVLFFFCSRKVGIVLLLIGLVGSAVMRWMVLLFAPEHSVIAESWTPMRIDAISIGCLMALIARSARGAALLDRFIPLAIPAMGVLVLTKFAASMSGKIGVGVAPTVIAVCLGILVWSAARIGPRMLEWKPFLFFGAISYSLYLWQQPFLNRESQTWWTAFPQNLGFAGIAAVLSYYLIEKPFLKLKGRGGH